MNSKYSFKFMHDSSKVYVATLEKSSIAPLKRGLYDTKRCFITEPFNSKDHQTVVVGFANQVMLQYRLPTIINNRKRISHIAAIEDIQNNDLQFDFKVYLTTVGDMKSHCELLRLPLLVYLSAYCAIDDMSSENFEAFFHYHYPDDTFSSKDLQRFLM
jgi:hypothetical protein